MLGMCHAQDISYCVAHPCETIKAVTWIAQGHWTSYPKNLFGLQKLKAMYIIYNTANPQKKHLLLSIVIVQMRCLHIAAAIQRMTHSIVPGL